MFEQILSSSTIRNVQKTVTRVCVWILELKGLSELKDVVNENLQPAQLVVLCGCEIKVLAAERTYYNGSTAKSHSTTTQYRQLRRLEFYLSFSLSIADAKSLCHESSRELEKPEMPKRGREKPWLAKTNSGARLFDSGSLFRFVSNTFQPGFFFTSTFWKIFILVCKL